MSQVTQKLIGALAAISFSIVLAAPSFGHGDEDGPQPTGVVKERMDAMEKLKKSLVAIKNTLTEGEFDQAAVTDNAKKIGAFAGEPMIKLFPVGTNEAPSEALDVIWTDWDDFKIKATLLKTKADALAMAEGKEASMAAFGAMAQACGGCHKKFRLENEE